MLPQYPVKWKLTEVNQHKVNQHKVCLTSHVHLKEVSKYSLWTKEQLFDGAEKTLKEFLAEAPCCWKTYPNACYYLAELALLTKNVVGFQKSYELGQDAEEKRLPFLHPVNLPLKDRMTQDCVPITC